MEHSSSPARAARLEASASSSVRSPSAAAIASSICPISDSMELRSAPSEAVAASASTTLPVNLPTSPWIRAFCWAILERLLSTAATCSSSALFSALAASICPSSLARCSSAAEICSLSPVCSPCMALACSTSLAFSPCTCTTFCVRLPTSFWMTTFCFKSCSFSRSSEASSASRGWVRAAAAAFRGPVILFSASSSLLSLSTLACSSVCVISS
mmetsp:Transcript_91223/g.254012  ORF Transcript_91223/g.254012 Transcript_91223/m.254012 type:complete len:213 (-) Transcript_91223:271-909(-)